MSSALGLTTYRWNNNIKSALLLLAFPFLLLGLLGGFFYAVGFSSADAYGHVPPPVFLELGLSPYASGLSLSPSGLAAEGMKAFWPWVLGIAALWVAFGYFFNSAMIRAATGAKTVERRDAPELYNKLENLCIARGLKMPRLSIIEDRALNAFASGLDEGSFSVTVTRGLLENLDEAEVEAVLAHELTHILNRDVRLLIVTIVFTGMLSFLAQMLWRGLSQVSSSRSRERGKGSGGLLLIAALLAAAGYVLALVLRFALSRKREYLADAGAVELTKNPEAMIGALEKIAGHAQVADVPAEVRQMFIENPPSFFGLFDTHPRIADRINVLRELNRLPPPGESIIPEVG